MGRSERQNLWKFQMNNIIIVDIDGTIAKNNGRGWYDWNRVDEDSPIYDNIDLILSAASIYEAEIVILTGRNEGFKDQPDVCLNKTIKWLEGVLDYYDLIMKPFDSYEPSATFKAREVQRLLDEGYTIRMFFDDNEKVIDKIQKEFNINTVYFKN